ncbi:MAG: hypothetical protein K2X87_20020 [Gemmataceae bacterium]|nr:hypothetical protein [Gemmataceae bacterium]
MTLTLELPAPLRRRLEDKAAADGTTVEAAAVALLEKAAPPDKTFAEICAPFAAEFAASGMTEEELDALIEEARQEVWEEQQRRKGGS